MLAMLLALAACAGPQRVLNPWGVAPQTAGDPQAARIDQASRQMDDGLFDQARATVEALLAEGSTHPMTLLMRARLAEHDGDWGACVNWSRKAVEASPGWGEPRVLLARACLEAKRIEEADAAFADVDRILPDNPWGPYGRAWVAASRLDLPRAAGFADEALSRDPDHRPALLLRANIARLAGDAEVEERCLRRADALGDPDPEVMVRLAALAETAGRSLDAARYYERAWELRPGPDIAKRRLQLARLAEDQAAIRIWSRRAGTP